MTQSSSAQAMSAPKKEFHFSDADFKKLKSIVYDRTGISIADHKKDMIYGRIARRLRALTMKKFEDYIQFLMSEQGEEEVADFVNAVTTNLTRFFREDHHFYHLRDDVLKPLAEKPNKKRLRLWSAGCSSGMECYSMAIMVAESIPNLDSWDVKILATDIDSNMLKRGNDGIYTAKDIEDIPPEFRKKYFVRIGEKGAGTYQAVEKLRHLCFFKPLNFIEPWPVKGPFDVIFCRNVVIYFDKPTQQRVFNNFANVLGDDGWLYIGHSENLASVSDKFKLIGKTIYKKT